MTQSSFSGGFPTVLRRSGLRGGFVGDRCEALRFFGSGETGVWGTTMPVRRSPGVETDDFVGDGVRSLRGDAMGIVRSGDPSSCGIWSKVVIVVTTSLNDLSGKGEEGTLESGDDSPGPTWWTTEPTSIDGMTDEKDSGFASLIGDLERLILAASRMTSSGSSRRKVAALGPCTPENAF
ncbi:hypothetical protein N0V95_008374 [Ascochyta clinopodiicola]|nr:hypothetical protein N0V95_008374 [Ascochyta clinopodiicola]